MKKFTTIILLTASITSYANFNSGEIVDAVKLNTKFTAIKNKIQDLGSSVNFKTYEEGRVITSSDLNHNLNVIKNITSDFQIDAIVANSNISASFLNNIFSQIDTEVMKLFGKSCQDLITKQPSLLNKDGTYLIDLDGFMSGEPAFLVYCDMTTDGGGWTLVLEGSGNISPAPIELITATTQKYHSCLLDSVVNCPANKMYWQQKNIKGNSYLKKIGSSTPMVAQMNQEINWADMANLRTGDARFSYSYFTTNPSVHFAGYSSDSSSAPGCQDLAAGVYIYYFSQSNGNTPCGGSNSFLYPTVDGGFGDSNGYNQPSQIFTR